MRNKAEKIINVFDALLLFLCANSFIILRDYTVLIPVVIVLCLLCFMLPLYTVGKMPDKRIRLCSYGTRCLKVFLISAVASTVLHIVLAFLLLPEKWSVLLFSALVCVIVEAIMFWTGMISVYITSVQLGIKTRVIGILLGFVPVANLIELIKIIRITEAEVAFETQKYEVDISRQEERLCATKYPILLVHGVFFRDSGFLNYWGRIPKELIKNGATVYYGEHESASSVKDSAEELAEKIRTTVNETGCGKVNIIAHSKGGLDCRCAISCCGISQYVASLTTINTPHRGCLFADYLLGKAPAKLKDTVASAYNAAMRKLGDKNPDFLSSVYDLTSEHCEKFNTENKIPEGIVCQSVGSKLNRASGGKFPLNFSYLLVKHFDGSNDGLVGERSFRFGENYSCCAVEGKRGISHGDMIDLNRENIPGFDVREFYVRLVSDLKNRGL